MPRSPRRCGASCPLPRGHRIRVRPLDGVAGVAGLRDASADVVVVDAYAAGRVPPELATVEWFAEVGRTLAPGGLLLANVADEPGLRYAARVAAGARAALGHVAFVGLHEVLKGKRFGNLVLVGSATPVDLWTLRRAAASAPLPTGVLSVGRRGPAPTGCPAVLRRGRRHGILTGTAGARGVAPPLTGQSTQTRALRNIRSQGLSCSTAPEVHDICTLRATRSGCGIIAVKRPSGVVTAVRPSGEPLGLNG